MHGSNIAEAEQASDYEPFWRDFSAFDRTSVVELIDESTRIINHEVARRCAWIATRHDQIYAEWADSSAVLGPEGDCRAGFTDEFDQLVGEVGAVIGRGAGAARALIELSLALRDRTPLVFDMLYEGRIGETIARAVVTRAAAITDPAVMHSYDQAVSGLLGCKLARGRAVVSESAARRLADGVLATIDPDAVPVPASARRRGVWFDVRRDGLTEMAAVLFCEDGAYLDREVERIATTVCGKDPRSLGERRADGLVALVQGYETLGCRCESDGCEVQAQVLKHAAVEAKTVADVTVVLNESTVAGADDAPALIGGQPVPAALAREVIARVGEARFRSLGKPTGARVCAHDVAGYRPSALQADFLKIRYPECVFPGCAVRFDACQLDHVTEWNHRDHAVGGKTRIGNLVPLCPRHHRLKTEQNWLSDVLPGGEVEWHTPTGHVYRTAVVTGDDLFPDLDLIEWLAPVRRLKPAVPRSNGPTRVELRNAGREARREKYRRARETLRDEHPGDPRWNDEPPPY
ncbi:HNH endonuclease OS=Tsukamurella paurometabola (strain ATCC 8368 / DSM / CCUG 35730 / CIP 100753/ JCM 10117 / KCTC 9821 / NBRC 16120 / NCIMB 702349 / NCTC 13040) OX=521096 GN=Tpau_1708 PE=3 SV=1 [Tsukamurella paurometabola]|uniref:HNH endonuclease n=1 Tax=Tsukamurella paurometabola (strain ATCC 8368 / DSM 20162 / CCUG 35730 / CIP 100753 / JCM 10117 / KCTC 9821 / NBRC 16120 / NCIMB 702349 / NCTC 13040) TaxID=521096 RepID=D5UM46_TSUPD|nr:HNH endonuclease signature motif containing protein [Tsukamurella paurometabola]ADG78326.1 HNH endonuclease [Tsukamurella paurometabola DSM 20162]SUP31218.1 Domain of uncharacterised function DUF222 [Tsukamurella paurometabola]